MTRTIPLQKVRDAAKAIYDPVVRTPLVRLDVPEAWRTRVPSAPERLYLKLETLQPIGSFKIRGAQNAVRQLDRATLDGGVWTVSAGNAAQGVALAARAAGAHCSVMVMDTAPAAKIRAIEALGATIVRATYDECWRTVESRRSDRMTGYFVHPFDDDEFIAGNATIALEILDEIPQPDAIVAAIGGGGLLSGLGVVVPELSPSTRLFAAEPATAAPLATSLSAGTPSAFPGWTASFVDGAGGKSVLPSMFPLLQRTVTESIVVSLEEVADAMTLVAERLHVIAEGAGACAVAAALTGRAGSGTVVAIVSGGNIDLAKFATLTHAFA
ncbi:MAG: pyridoxal-phosphate dependent enzyme [Vicinamibacterales bacterium]